MADDEQVQRLTLETNLPEKMTEAAEAARKLKDEESALAAVMASIEQAGETLVISTDAAAVSSRSQAMETAELVRITREATAAEEEKAVKIDAATQRMYDQIHASENMREMMSSMSPIIADVAGVSEEGGGGFAGLAGNIVKAEKAGLAIASGHGLGRVGPMLESITSALGMTGGVGMAAGGLLFALEGILPKIKDFISAWEMGIKPLDDATAAIERLTRAEGSAGGAREGRALKKIDSQMMALEDKFDEQGFLSLEDSGKLNKLREASQAKHKEIDDQAAEAKATEAAIKERNEKEDIRAGAEIEENDPDQQFMIRHKHALERGRLANQADREQAAKRKRVEANLNRATNEGVSSLEQEERLAEQEKRERERNEHAVDVATAQAEARQKREEARAEKAGTPLATSRRAQKEDQNQMLGVVQANTQGFTPEQQRHISKQALENVSMGADLATAVNQAVYDTQVKIRTDFMKMMSQQSQMRGDW